jgi:RNA methyltransferase, TrmH family
MITSSRNPKIQRVRALQSQTKARREAGVFVVEGVRLLEEAYHRGWIPELVLYCDGITKRGSSLLKTYQGLGIPVEQVTPQVLKAASDTESPQGLLAVLPVKELPLPLEPTFILILDAIRDPGNLGTILRTAAAASVEAVLMTPGTTDPFASKVIRSGMGAHFSLPMRSFQWREIVDYLGLENPTRAIKIYLADAGAGLAYTKADFKSPIALVIGGEAEGAGEEARRLSDERVHIPLSGRAESLNAGVAAGILLFEVVRQRNLTRS